MIWDRGTWEPDEPDVNASLKAGELKFTLYGSKLKGSWVLVRTKGLGNAQRSAWLLIKHRDKHASMQDVVEAKPRSALSRRLMAQIAAASGGNVGKAAKSDPQIHSAGAN